METDNTCQEIIFSCKKCRQKLFEDSNLVDEHESIVTDVSQHYYCGESQPEDYENTVWFINVQNMPEWMQELVNEARWIKGKLLCPKCGSRLGSFDFVSSSKCPCGRNVLPPVHIVKTKVDMKDPNSSPFLRRPSGTYLFANSSVEVKKHEMEESKGFPQVVVEEDCAFPVSTIASAGLDTLLVDTSQIKIKKCQKTRFKKADLAATESEEKAVNSVPMDPPEDVICPVCLDIYMNPFICYPCVHVFCEICLRHIARTDPQKTLCPLCRQQIGMCLPDHDRSHKVRTLYPTAHKSRQRTLNKLRNFPLPWQPHYRLRQLSSLGRSFIWNDHRFMARETNVRNTMWETLSTVALLIFLQLAALLAFFIGYHGGKYVLGMTEIFGIGIRYILEMVFGQQWMSWFLTLI